MTIAEIEEASSALARHGATIERGLSEGELQRAEHFVGVKFPPDLRLLLTAILPTGTSFPNWRKLDAKLEDALNWPFEGVCFDIEHNDLWLAAWGAPPATVRAKVERLRHLLEAAPVLLPVFSHRYLPASPCEAGNPVFSVYQSDIIHYGDDLTSYLAAEFGAGLMSHVASVRHIPFWDELVTANNGAQ